MTLKTFEEPAAYMLHDIGPRRFSRRLPCMTDWGRTKLGKRLLAIMAPYGLGCRDAFLGVLPDNTYLSTDVGGFTIADPAFESQRGEIEAAFASLAAGVAQERMLRLSGWRRDQPMPRWAVTASDVLVERARSVGRSPADIWDIEGRLGSETYIRFCNTGMHLTWGDDELYYQEDQTRGATLMLPTALLDADPATLPGRLLADSCSATGDLANALGRYRITGTTAIEPDPHACSPEPHHTLLRLAVPMRTLEPVPRCVLARAGVDVPDGIGRDYPLWMLTSPAQLRTYRPRLD